jgi:hypothetical protein
VFTPQRSTPFCLIVSRVGPALARAGSSAAAAIAAILIQVVRMVCSLVRVSARTPNRCLDTGLH